MANFRSAAAVVSTITSSSSSASKESGSSTGTPRSSNSDDQALRTRHSFFGHSRSTSQVRPTPRSHGASASVHLPTTSRPNTPDTVIRTARTREKDSLDIIRKSLFGSRRKGTASARPTTPNVADKPSQHTFEPMFRHTSSLQLSRWQRYESDEEHQRSPKKPRISTPFNFQHVSHAGKELSSSLATVHERDLAAQFWFASNQPPPSRHAQDMNGETVSEKQRATSLSPSPDMSRSTRSRTSEAIVSRDARSIDGTMVDEGTNKKYDADVPINDGPAAPSYRLARRPARNSPLSGVRPVTPRREPRSPSIIYEDPSPTEGTTNDRRSTAVRIAADVTMALVKMTGKDLDLLAKGPLPGFMDRTKLPLPPLPQSPPIPERSIARSIEGLNQKLADLPMITRKARNRTISIICPPAASIASSTDGGSSTTSRRSPWSDCRSPETPRYSSDGRTVSMATDATWEDDVDFCYEQEAESTCNFEWEPTISEQRLSTSARTRRESGVMPPLHWFARPYALPNVHDSKGGAKPMHAAKPSIGKLYPGRPSPLGRQELLIAYPHPTHSSAFPTSVAEHAPGRHRTLHSESHSIYHSESCGSKHRVSSSYSSTASSAFPPARGTSRDPTTRWSFASSTNVPDLLPSTADPHNSRSPLPKHADPVAVQSAVLDSTASRAVPIKPISSKPPSVTRTRQTSSDRAILQNVGQAIGRGRARTQKPVRPPRPDVELQLPCKEPPRGWF